MTAMTAAEQQLAVVGEYHGIAVMQYHRARWGRHPIQRMGRLEQRVLFVDTTVADFWDDTLAALYAELHRLEAIVYGR